MITKSYNTWKFEELPEDIQEKVLDRYRYFNVEDSEWYDYDGKTGFTTKELRRMKVKPADAPCDLITYKKLYFDLDRSWYIQFVDAEFSNDEIARKFLRVPSDIWNRVCWNIVDCPSHEGNTRLEYEWEGDKELTKRQEMILERACEMFADKISEALKGLQNSYEYACSDEAVKESLIANEYDFNEQGEIS